MRRKDDFSSVDTRGECRHSKQQRSAEARPGRTAIEQRRSEDAVDDHQGENSASGAVVEEFQFSRMYAVDLDLLSKSLPAVDKHALQIASFAEDVHEVGQVWPCQLPGSTSSALHADWKTNTLHHQG